MAYRPQGWHPPLRLENTVLELPPQAREAQAVLDDYQTVEEGLGWLDPHLALATVNRALSEAA